MSLKIEDTTFRQCWAYNSKGQRCEHPAAHPGNHVVSSEWSDAECVAPTTVTVAPVVTATAPSGTVTVTDPDSRTCVACGHRHKGGMCKCGCHEQIG